MGTGVKGYVIGVSSGMFGIAQQEEKEQYLTILKKAFWGAMRGVDFAQIDLESITEFNEPFIDEEIKKMKELGIKFGIHGETAATTREHTMPLDSSIFDDYERAHKRLIKHIEGGGKIGAEYVLTHASELTPIILVATREQTSTKLCDIWGRPMEVFLEENEWLLDWAIKQSFITELRHIAWYIGRIEKQDLDEYAKRIGKKPEELTQADVENLKSENAKNAIKKYVSMRDLDFGSERMAYFLIARWMQIMKDPIWLGIVGEGFDFNNDTYRQYEKWVPAAAAKYLWGHFNPLPKERLKGIKKDGSSWSAGPFDDPKPLLEKHKMYWVFEPQMAQLGFEEHLRLHKITHIYQLVINIPSKWVGVTIDVEHLLSGNVDPMKEVDALPYNGGERVNVVHLGWPTPHIPAHIPIYLGSEAQEYIYKFLFKLRKKGWKNGVLIFERAGGADPVKESVISLRKCVQFLELDTPPDKLPPDFYGVGEEGPEVARQLVTIKEHAFDPLKGVLHVPEEEFGFLSTAAAQKGKIEEWRKEKFK